MAGKKNSQSRFPCSIHSSHYSRSPNLPGSHLPEMTRCYLSAQSSPLIGLVAADRIRTQASQTQAPESHSPQQADCSGGVGGYLPRHPSSPDTGRHSCFAPYLSKPVCVLG